MTASVTDNTTMTEETTDHLRTDTMTDDAIPGISTAPELRSPAMNETAQLFEQQTQAAIPVAVTFSDSATSRKLVLVSNITTRSAGYTNIEPSTPLDNASYSNGYWSPAVVVTRNSLWYDNTRAPFGSGAKWISSQATTEGGNGNQWRLFKTDFNIPKGSTLTSAQLWYTADNAAAVYLNEAEINSTGSVYGTPDGSYIFSKAYTVNFTPRTGSNALKFVVRNWRHTQYNPTGLLYKVMIEYEPEPLVANFTGSPRSGTTPLTVSFNDTSTGWPTFWNWSFGDGQMSLQQNTSHTYTAEGNYTVSLTVSNVDGSDTEVKTGYITVMNLEEYTYSLTCIENYDNKGHLGGVFDECNNVASRLNATPGWKMVFYHKDDEVTPFDFGTSDDHHPSLADSTFYYHSGHGVDPLHAQGNVIGTIIMLKNYNEIITPPFYQGGIVAQDVNQKWGGKNKWVMLQSCSILVDRKWDNTLTTSHGILGYSSATGENSDFPNIFFDYAINKQIPIITAYRDATIKVFNDPNIQGAVIVKTIDQYNNEQFPGVGYTAPDGDPGTKPIFRNWSCVMESPT